MHAPRIVHVEVVFTMKSGAWFQRNLDATMNYRRWPRYCRTHLSPPRRPGFPAARRHYFGQHLRGFKAVGAVNSFALRCLSTQVDLFDATCAPNVNEHLRTMRNRESDWIALLRRVRRRFVAGGKIRRTFIARVEKHWIRWQWQQRRGSYRCPIKPKSEFALDIRAANFGATVSIG